MSRKPLGLVSGALVWMAVCGAAQRGELPSIGESIVISDIKVTLLEVRRFSEDEYFEATGAPPPEWAGGGLRLLFLVENRTGAPTAPVLGNVRVLLASKPYNTVTNATSQDPFAPDAIVHSVEAFFAGRSARHLQRPTPRRGSVANVLEVFVRGGPIRAGASGTVELEQGETHRADATGRLVPIKPSDTRYHWFKFRLPTIN